GVRGRRGLGGPARHRGGGGGDARLAGRGGRTREGAGAGGQRDAAAADSQGRGDDLHGEDLGKRGLYHLLTPGICDGCEMIRFERGHRHLLAGQFVRVAGRRRGGEHADELPGPCGPRGSRGPGEARQGALVRSGRAVEKLIGGLPADPAVMACVHLTSFSAKSLICVTGSVSGSSRAFLSSFLLRLRRPRLAAVRMAPARLPRMVPAVVASRPRTARSRTASAWSGGRVAIRAMASAVATASRACWAVAGQVARSSAGTGRAGLRWLRRRWSRARWRAMVAAQPRKPS